MKDAFEAFNAFGCPSRIRGDPGVENGDVRAFMELVRGPDRGSYIPGKSVHNVPIERLWRDVHSKVTRFFRKLFMKMENELCVWSRYDAVDSFCLTYVFQPIIQAALDFFSKTYWNNHR